MHVALLSCFASVSVIAAVVEQAGTSPALPSLPAGRRRVVTAVLIVQPRVLGPASLFGRRLRAAVA